MASTRSRPPRRARLWMARLRHRRGTCLFVAALDSAVRRSRDSSPSMPLSPAKAAMTSRPCPPLLMMTPVAGYAEETLHAHTRTNTTPASAGRVHAHSSRSHADRTYAPALTHTSRSGWTEQEARRAEPRKVGSFDQPSRAEPARSRVSQSLARIELGLARLVSGPSWAGHGLF